MNNNTGLVLDNRYFNHVIERQSLENPERLRNLYQILESPKYKGRFTKIDPREIHISDVHTVHSSFYIDQLRNHSINKDPYSYDKDTYLMDQSLHTAQLAAGGCFQLVDKIMSQELSQGFALIRPPGHHAEMGRGMGFCILNNVALAARYLMKNYGLNRIMIIDFDVHHGNGTQDVFYEDNEVLFLSIHQKGIFPFSGDPHEIGKGKGEGYSVNIPVFSQFGDTEYTFLLGRLLQSLVEQYLPQFILVSAGYDAHVDDSISGTTLSTDWYRTATLMLRQYAEEACDGRLLFILEGGYNPVSLESSVLATIDGLLQPMNGRVGVLHSNRAEKVLHNHPARSFWTI